MSISHRIHRTPSFEVQSNNSNSSNSNNSSYQRHSQQQHHYSKNSLRDVACYDDLPPMPVVGAFFSVEPESSVDIFHPSWVSHTHTPSNVADVYSTSKSFSHSSFTPSPSSPPPSHTTSSAPTHTHTGPSLTFGTFEPELFLSPALQEDFTQPCPPFSDPSPTSIFTSTATPPATLSPETSTTPSATTIATSDFYSTDRAQSELLLQTDAMDPTHVDHPLFWDMELLMNPSTTTTDKMSTPSSSAYLDLFPDLIDTAQDEMLPLSVGLSAPHQRVFEQSYLMYSSKALLMGPVDMFADCMEELHSTYSLLPRPPSAEETTGTATAAADDADVSTCSPASPSPSSVSSPSSSFSSSSYYPSSASTLSSSFSLTLCESSPSSSAPCRPIAPIELSTFASTLASTSTTGISTPKLRAMPTTDITAHTPASFELPRPDSKKRGRKDVDEQEEEQERDVMDEEEGRGRGRGRRRREAPRNGRRTNRTQTTKNPVYHKCVFPGCSSAPFQRRYNLLQHELIHLPEKDRPHACRFDGCERRFNRSDDLVRHHTIHTGDKPLDCEKCPMSFSRREARKRHYKRFHP